MAELNQTQIRELYLEGKRFFPNIKIFNARVNGSADISMRVFLNHPESKDSFSLETFEHMLCCIKLKRIGLWIEKKGCLVKWSKSTESVYIYDRKNNPQYCVRFSDHPKPIKSKLITADILVSWRTTAQEILNHLYPYMEI
jgi:hypothetical protein